MQKYDAMCILPINIVNEKIYVALWFWFYLIAVVTVLTLIYRLLVIVFNQLKVNRLKQFGRLCHREDLEYIVNRMQIGDWFLLSLISKNMDPLNFKELINQLMKSD